MSQAAESWRKLQGGWSEDVSWAESLSGPGPRDQSASAQPKE